MATLKIQGYEVPIAQGAGRHSSEEYGSRNVASSGALQLHRIAQRRVYEGSTIWLRRVEALGLRGLLEGRGDHWAFDLSSSALDTYSGKGLPAESGAVTSHHASEFLRSGDATYYTIPKYGDAALGVWAATENLFAANVRTGTDSGGNTVGFTAIGVGTAISNSNGDVTAWTGADVLKVVLGGGAGDGVYTDSVAAAAGVQHAASVYLRTTAGSAVVKIYLRNNTTAVNGTTQNVTLNADRWQRVEVLSPAAVNIADDLRLYLIDTNAAAATYYCDGFQLEARSFSSTWVNGSRAACALAYTLPWLRLGADDLTLMFWTRGPARFAEAVASFAWHLGDASDFIEFYWYDSEWWAACGIDGAISSTHDGDAAWSADWKHVVISLQRTSEYVGGNNYVVRYWVDGASVSGSQTAAFGTINLPTNPILYVGADEAGSNQLNGLIDDLVVLPFALGDDQVSGIYAAGYAWRNLPALNVSGAALAPDANPIAMVGRGVVVADGTHASPSGTVTPEVVSKVDFTLEEEEPVG